MVRIRLRRIGAKNQPSYRIVAADQQSPRDGRFLEILGFYNPRTDPSTIQFEEERIYDWLSKGAQPSESVRQILNSVGFFDRYERYKAGESTETLLEESAAALEAHTAGTDVRPSVPTEEEEPEPEVQPAAEEDVEVEAEEEVEPESEQEVEAGEEVEAEAEQEVEAEEEAEAEAEQEVEAGEDAEAEAEQEVEAEEEAETEAEQEVEAEEEAETEAEQEVEAEAGEEVEEEAETEEEAEAKAGS